MKVQGPSFKKLSSKVQIVFFPTFIFCIYSRNCLDPSLHFRGGVIVGLQKKFYKGHNKLMHTVFSCIFKTKCAVNNRHSSIYIRTPTENETPVCQLSGVSTRFQVYCPCLHLAHWNASVNGANFTVNRH